MKIRGTYYLLNGHEPVVTHDRMAWARMMESPRRCVGLDKVGNKTVSTVFLGIDVGFGEDEPLLFETVIFGPLGEENEYMDRCSTWEEAEEMHRVACVLAEKGSEP